MKRSEVEGRGRERELGRAREAGTRNAYISKVGWLEVNTNNNKGLRWITLTTIRVANT